MPFIADSFIPDKKEQETDSFVADSFVPDESEQDSFIPDNPEIQPKQQGLLSEIGEQTPTSIDETLPIQTTLTPPALATMQPAEEQQAAQQLQKFQETAKYNPVTAAAAYEASGFEKGATMGYGHGIENLINQTPLASQNIDKGMAENFGYAMGMIVPIGGISKYFVEAVAPSMARAIPTSVSTMVKSAVDSVVKSVVKSGVTGATYGLARKPEEEGLQDRTKNAVNDMLLFAAVTGVAESAFAAVDVIPKIKTQQKFDVYHDLRDQTIQTLKSNLGMDEPTAQYTTDSIINARITQLGGWEKVTPKQFKSGVEQMKEVRETPTPKEEVLPRDTEAVTIPKEEVVPGEKTVAEVLKTSNEGLPAEVQKSSTEGTAQPISEPAKPITEGVIYERKSSDSRRLVKMVEGKLRSTWYEPGDDIKTALWEDVDAKDTSNFASDVQNGTWKPQVSEPAKPMVFETTDGKRITIEDVKPVEAQPVETPQMPQNSNIPNKPIESPEPQETPLESQPVKPEVEISATSANILEEPKPAVEGGGISTVDRVLPKELKSDWESWNKPAPVELLSAPKENVKQLFERFLKQGKEQGLEGAQLIRYANDRLKEFNKPEQPTLNYRDHPVQEMPLSELKLSKDVPNFKKEADAETGIIENDRLQGKYRRLGIAPIVVWERLNGDKEIITGRHRYDLAIRSGEETIPTQIVKESDGFTKDRALTIDAESNILEGQGSVEDYARYFRESREVTEETAREGGLLSRAKGKIGFRIGRSAKDALWSSYQNGQITDNKAYAIANGAPNNEGAQIAALKKSARLTADELQQYAKILSETKPTQKAEQGDLFGYDESSLIESENIAKEVSKEISRIKERITAVKGALKNPRVAEEMGIQFNNEQDIRNAVDTFNERLARLDKVSTDKELYNEMKVRTLKQAVQPAGGGIAGFGQGTKEQPELPITEKPYMAGEGGMPKPPKAEFPKATPGAYEKLSESKPVLEAESPIKQTAEKIYQNFFNRFASIENIASRAIKAGLKLKSGDNPALRAREYLGISQKVQSVLEHNTFKINPEGNIEKTGEGLKPILTDYEKNTIEKKLPVAEQDLKEFLIAQRTISDLQRPKYEGGENIVTPEQVDEANRKIESLTNKYGENLKVLQDTAIRLYDYQKRVLHTLVDSGNMSEETFKQITERNQHYIPFDRVMDDIEQTFGVPKNKNRFTEARSPIKRIKGSEREIENPIESIIKNTYRIMDSAERNTVARGVANLAETFPEEIQSVDIPIVPVARITHHAVIDSQFMKEIKDFAGKMGAKFTTGRETSPGSMLGSYTGGIYKEVMHKQATPSETMAHEVGHFFDDKFKLKQRFYKRGNTKNVAEELITFMREQHGEPEYRIKKSQERFARGFEWWLLHRDLAEKDIPQFSGVMRSIIRDIPELEPLLKIRPHPGKGFESQQETIFAPSPYKPKGNVIEYYEDGNKKYMEVSPNLYQAMTGLNETSIGLLTKILSKPTSWLRVGATITPEFMLRNPIRDQMTAVLQTSFGFKPFIDSGKAIADIIGKTEVYQDWLRSGGAYSGFVELSRPELTKAYQELMKRPNLLRKLNIITHAQDLSQLFEQATRVGVYKAAIKAGKTPVEAGFESRESTVDFGRRGALSKDVNALIAFFNAGIQGADKSIRAMARDPIGVAIKGIALITIPSLLLWLRNKDDKNYAEIPRWQKDIFWVTKLPGTNNYVRIPKPFLYGQIFGSIPERFLEYLNTKDKNAFDGLYKSLFESVLPITGDPVAGLLPTSLKPIIENSANWNLFRQAPIIPAGKQDLMPREQYGRYTTDIAKAVGKLLNISPAKIENFAQGWFGGTGKYALQGGDLLINQIKRAAGVSIPERPKDITQMPLIRGFSTGDPTESGSANSINKFYDNRENLMQYYQTYVTYLETGRKEEANKLQTEHPELVLSKSFDKIGVAMSTLNKKIDLTLNSDMPVTEKKSKINKLNKRRLGLALKGNKILNENIGKND